MRLHRAPRRRRRRLQARAGREQALSDFLAAAGVLIAAAAAAASILLPPGRLRSVGDAAGARPASRLLILGDQWHSTADRRPARRRRRGSSRSAIAGLAAAASSPPPSVAGRSCMPLAIVAALPFRVPLHAGGDTANLLVPLYLVIAGGVLADGAARSGERGAARGRAPAGPGGRRWLPRVLAAVVVLYALQTLYSPDFSKSLQNVCFFFVPFSLVYALLRDVEWDRRLLRRASCGWSPSRPSRSSLVGTVEYVEPEACSGTTR